MVTPAELASRAEQATTRWLLRWAEDPETPGMSREKIIDQVRHAGDVALSYGFALLDRRDGVGSKEPRARVPMGMRLEDLP